MSYTIRDIELFKLWGQRATLVTIIKELEMQLTETQIEIIKAQAAVDAEKKAK